MSLSDSQKEKIREQAEEDHAEGTETKYKGDALVDTVFAIPDLLTGDRSTHEIAADKQDYYDKVRESLDDD